MSTYETPTPARTDSSSATLSIVGIILGIIAVFFVPPLFGLAGLACGLVAKSKRQRYATAAIVVSIVGLVLGMVLGIAILSARR